MPKVKIKKKQHKIKYSCAVPIKPAICTAWLLNLPGGEQRILLWHSHATIQDVHAACKVRHNHTEFTLGVIDNGELKIQEHIMTFRSDSRWVDQDWVVGVKWLDLLKIG